MYAILHKNKIISGPKEWNRAFFTFRLKEVGIEKTIPKTPPSVFPFVLNEDTKILKVSVNYDEINPITQFHTGPIWEINQDQAAAFYNATNHPIEVVKDTLRKQTADERYKKEISGVKVTIQEIEVTVDTNRKSRDGLIHKLLLMDENITVNWKFPETWLVLTKTDLELAVKASENHIQSCFDWEREINLQIDDAETTEQLLALEITKLSEESEFYDIA